MSDLLELTARAEATHFWFRGFRMYVVPAIQEIVAGRRGLRIIDCGCGTGFNLKTLLMPHGRACAFDVVPEGIRRARAVGRPLVRADIQHIPFTSASFDLATSFDVIQSVPDDRAALGSDQRCRLRAATKLRPSQIQRRASAAHAIAKMKKVAFGTYCTSVKLAPCIG